LFVLDEMKLIFLAIEFFTLVH